MRAGVASLVLFAAASLVYANSLAGAFVFDDTVIIQGNEAIRGLDLEHLRQIFGGHYWKAVESRGGLYRPVVMLTYALNYAMGGEDPEGYHLFNILVHAANGIWVFVLLEALFRHRAFSLLAALLFVLHPIRTEGVASIVGRAESLSTFFMLAAWWLYAQARRAERRAWLWLSVASFALATLCKESAFAFAAFLPLTDFITGPGRVRDRFRFRATLLRYSPFVAALVLVVLLRHWVLGGLAALYINPVSNPLVNADGWTRFLTATHVFGRYLALLAFPRNLSADYSYNQIPLATSIFAWKVLVPLALLVLLLAGTVVAARRFPILFFSGFVLFAGFALTSNWIRPIGTIMGERLMYFPALGFNCAVVFVLCKGLESARFRPAAWILSTLLALAYAIGTIDRNVDWRNHYNLFRRAVATSPNSSLVQSNYAAVLLHEKNDPRGAIVHARRAVEISPKEPPAYFTLGSAYRRLGELEHAAEAFGSVVALAPRTSGGAAALREMANIHEAMARLELAKPDYEKLIEWRPSDVAALLALSRIYRSQGNHAGAAEVLARAAHLAPEDPEVKKALR